MQHYKDTDYHAGAKQLYGYNWTTTPPTVEGWYWARVKDDRWIGVELVHVQWNSKHELVFTINNWREELPLTDATHFLGPLPEPEPPEE